MKQRIPHRMVAVAVMAIAAITATSLMACAEVGSGPSVPAAIEMLPFPAPAVVVGDTLRSIDGRVAPVRALVRNAAGDAIDNAPVRYLYADFNRDSALFVDSVSGIVVALKPVTREARIAARVGGALQILRPLQTTTRPDTVFAASAPAPFRVTLPDTGRVAAQGNTAPAPTITVQSLAGAAASGVGGWMVRFELIRPANPTNDTSAAVFLVDDRGSASILDTTDNSGGAGRRIRIRAATFPASTAASAVDTVALRATVLYRGLPVRGAPLTLRVPVRR